MSEASAPPVSIVEFLEARLAEREQWCTPKPGQGHHWCGPHDADCDVFVLDGIGNIGSMPCSCGEPARALADIAAKRAIVQTCDDFIEGEPVNAWYDGGSPVDLAREVLRQLASIYSDHPDYREEWRP